MKKGFTLLEVVIALAVISIVSVAIFSTISFASQKNNVARAESFFMLESENYLLAYYLGQEGYGDAMHLLTGENYTYGTDATIHYSKDCAITGESNAFYRVELDFEIDYFEIRCLGNRQIYSYRVNR